VAKLKEGQDAQVLNGRALTRTLEQTVVEGILIEVSFEAHRAAELLGYEVIESFVVELGSERNEERVAYLVFRTYFERHLVSTTMEKAEKVVKKISQIMLAAQLPVELP